jgi:chromate transporter
MSEDDFEIWSLAVTFVTLSFLAVGGVNALVPEIQRQVVDVHGWMSANRFTDFFAMSQAAPGPNLTVISIIGWVVAGLPGVLTTNVAFIAPTSILTYFLSRTWEKFRKARWRMAIQYGLLPVTIGLVAASSYVLSTNSGDGLLPVLITGTVAATVYWTRIHPLILMAAGASLGIAGFV